ncbi:Sugar transferase involved in LPS biosynthesis (colanic, teichoic acid) [Rhizobium sp. NFR07]|nr:Sugar transferase involved in LPS biosynthesis (colanic, teichoic acid) [Rhizobium sp. NFR07]
MSSLASPAMAPGVAKANSANDTAMRSVPTSPATLGSSPANNNEYVRQPAPERSFIPRWMSARIATSTFLIVGDVASYFAAYSFLRPLLPGSTGDTLVERTFALAALATIILYASASLYPGYRLHGHEHLRRRIMASIKIAALTAIGAVVLPGESQLLLAIFGFLCVALIVQPAMHWTVRGMCRRLGIWGDRAAIIAGGNHTQALIAHFADNWQYGIRAEAFSSDMAEISPDRRPSIALITGDADSPVAELATMRRTFAEVILLSDTPRLKVTGVRPADIGGEIGVRLAAGERLANFSLLRRAVDLAIAVPAILMVTPFMLVAAAAIYAIDPGPIFFRQAREGLSGKTLYVLKLRTMYTDAEQRLEALFRDNPAMQAEWATHFKLKRDPRILPVIGNALRSTSFDELPQLINIIMGEMAIVGPRPFPEYHLRAMDSEFRDKRCSVTPGLTGLWQISGRSNTDLELQQQLDEFYIDNKSLWFDWHILLSTIPAVLKRSGAC